MVACQVEEELRAERAQAEAEELRAKQAIEQKQQELQQIETAREKEVCHICPQLSTDVQLLGPISTKEHASVHL